MTTDAERLDWLEADHTLHHAVEMLYAFDGFEVEITYDCNHSGDEMRDMANATLILQAVEKFQP